MKDPVLTSDKLDKAVVRLEQVISTRIAAVERDAAGRIAAAEKANEKLQAEVAALKAKVDALNRSLERVTVDYRVLEEVASTVSGRLDTAVGRVRELLDA
jgi:multidrug resistance efflux pump